jgi:hypothetical protein
VQSFEIAWVIEIGLFELLLVGGLEHVDYFSIQFGIIIPTD